jgi:hypothetical protein
MAAPKGNKYALGNNGGRPPHYKTVEELQSAINDYFEGAPEKPTVTGLALELGFLDRSSLYNYKERKEFSDTIKRAVLKIESKHEERLYENGATGSIFWLKNRDWKDKTETDLNVNELPTLKVEEISSSEG